MKKNNAQSGIGDIADILLVCANILFGILIVYCLIVVMAPLFGGTMLPMKRLLPFAYWAGYYFVARYFLKNMKDKTKLKNYQYWLIGLYYSSLGLSIPPPYGYIVFILFFIFFMKAIQREIVSWDIDTNMGDSSPNKSLHQKARAGRS